jgi:hypothetical protein
MSKIITQTEEPDLEPICVIRPEGFAKGTAIYKDKNNYLVLYPVNKAAMYDITHIELSFNDALRKLAKSYPSKKKAIEAVELQYKLSNYGVIGPTYQNLKFNYKCR